MKIEYYITLRDFMLCVSIAGMFALVFGLIAGMLAVKLFNRPTAIVAKQPGRA